MGMIYGMGTTMMIGNIMQEWVLVPYALEGLAFDFVKAILFSHLYRVVALFMYTIARGESYATKEDKEEDTCVDCIQYVQDSLGKFRKITQVLSEYSVRGVQPEPRSFQMAQGLSDDGDEPTMDLKEFKAMTMTQRRKTYLEFITTAFDPETKEMREGYVARSTLNEMCMRFPDKYKEQLS